MINIQQVVVANRQPLDNSEITYLQHGLLTSSNSVAKMLRELTGV